jgi:hypothetical protein
MVAASAAPSAGAKAAPHSSRASRRAISPSAGPTNSTGRPAASTPASLARIDQPREAGLERHQVGIGRREGGGQVGAGLGRQQADIVQSARLGGGPDFPEARPRADEKKHDLRPRLELFGRVQHGGELMHAAEVAGISDDKFVRHAPSRTPGDDGCGLAGVCSSLRRPVGRDRDPVRRHARAPPPPAHVFAEGHAVTGPVPSDIAQGAQRIERGCQIAPRCAVRISG